MKGESRVVEYLDKHERWRDKLTPLRKVLLASELEETIKWGAPCYTLAGTNVIGLAAFKSHVALWFHQGALMSDPLGVLINAQEGKTKALRQWRFTDDAIVRASEVQPYIEESIRIQRAGKTLKPGPKKPFTLPEALIQALAENESARVAFYALSIGKQREYAEHMNSAKREDTRVRRIEKIVPMILKGKGLNDRYR